MIDGGRRGPGPGGEQELWVTSRVHFRGRAGWCFFIVDLPSYEGPKGIRRPGVSGDWSKSKQ